MPYQDLVSAVPITQVQVQIEPVQHAINSLMLLSMADEKPGMNDWVRRTAEGLSPEVRHRNQLVMVGLYYAVLPERTWSSFPIYIDHLQKLPAEALRDKLMDGYESLACQCPPENLTAVVPIDRQTALKSPEDYLAFLRQRFPEEIIDEPLERQAYSYATNPPAMQQLIVSHLKEMWVTYLEAEWEHVRSMLMDAVRAFQQVDFSGMSKIEAARYITGQDLSAEKWESKFEAASQVVFIPSAHIGPYLWSFKREDALGLLFGARLPTGTTYRAPDLSRAELLTRLSALADDSRLLILKYIADHGEQRSQDIIAQLDFSQSAASRHLTQLSATGFLQERRCEGAKCYRLNLERIEETSQALLTYMKTA